MLNVNIASSIVLQTSQESLCAWKKKFEPFPPRFRKCIESATELSPRAYILNRHKAFACIRPSSLSCHSLVIPRLFYCAAIYVYVYIYARIRGRERLSCLTKKKKKNKPPLIHVFLPWRGTRSKPGSRRMPRSSSPSPFSLYETVAFKARRD